MGSRLRGNDDREWAWDFTLTPVSEYGAGSSPLPEGEGIDLKMISGLRKAIC